MPPAPATTKTVTSKTSVSLGKEGLLNSATEMETNHTTRKLRSANNNNEEFLPTDQDIDFLLPQKQSEALSDTHVPLQIVYKNVLLFVYLHLAAVYGAYLWLSGEVMFKTFLWGTRAI